MNLITEYNPKSGVAEAYRTVRTNISFSDIDNKQKSILFTSTRQNEGKSTIVSNIANSFSKLEGKKVLIIDLDLRNPTVHRIFARSNTYGIVDYLKGDVSIEKCLHKCGSNLYIMPSGTIPPNPTETLSSNRMREFIIKIRADYDYVLIDSPPVGVVSDASIISSFVDGVMFVVGTNETDISYAQLAIENLKKAGANIIGAVLNKFDMNDGAYAYYNYYGYYQEESGRMNKKANKKIKKGLFKKKLGTSR